MTIPAAVPDLEEVFVTAPLEPWQLVVWDDPVNLMSYVVRVFRRYFGYSTEHATSLMLAVHQEGHAIVATGPRETMEVHAQAMHDYGLWATIRKAS
ncbi:ATP-dependent Clp protease adapter ClpS [Microbacterium sp.]|uniref:ATP-dependent Clp protease adapter ClpS n=1 Tax=Microbacterium sp. TaxID=51671 RepID=UPI00333FB166